MSRALLLCAFVGCSIDHTGLGGLETAPDAAADQDVGVDDTGPLNSVDAQTTDTLRDAGNDTPDVDIADALDAASLDVGVDVGIGDPDTGPSCTDGRLNGDESDTDCGGSCDACRMGATCRAGSDCRTQHCDADDIRCRLPKSCFDLLSGDATLVTGAYAIDTDGSGGGAAFQAWCDMDYAGGGWTLVVSSDAGGGASVEGDPLPGTMRHMSRDRMQPLALSATQVHIRTSGQAATRSVTSAPNSPPIVNLRAFNMLEVVNGGPSASDTWRGPMVSHVQYSCPPLTLPYPSVFHACGNGAGIHWYDGRAEWEYQVADEALELYVR